MNPTTMEVPVTIRRATPADVAAILDLRHAMIAEHGRPPSPGFILANELWYADALERRIYHAWLAERDGAPVGTAGVTISYGHPRAENLSGREGDVHNVYVAPEARRRGVALALMQTVIDWARADGFPRLLLRTSEMGRPLYELLGFEPNPELVLWL